jgi:alpha-beta hydrolase superfamily lysophospholipase
MRLPLALACVVTLAACASGTNDERDETQGSESAIIGPDIPIDACPKSNGPVAGMTTAMRNGNGALIRTGTMGSGTAGDVLFLHGFADRFDNHLPLFNAFVAKGLRVITFDYPSHGESCGLRIDMFGFTGLARLAADIVKEAGGDKTKPLYISGWSTGGLLAVRIAQGLEKEKLERPIAGMALFAPGVDVQLISPAADPIFGVTNEKLTRNKNPPHVGPIRPKNVLQVGVFGAELTFNEQVSQSTDFPSDIPTLVFTGGDTEDLFAATKGVEDWVTEKRTNNKAQIQNLKCAGGFHELDNEPEPMGGAVRNAAATYLAGTNRVVLEGGGCTSLTK